MDFFDRQDKARRGTKILVAYFVAGVLALTLAVYLAVLLVFAGTSHRNHHYYEQEFRPQTKLWNPNLFFGVAAGTLIVVTLGSLYRTAELSAGGRKVAEMLGGVLITPNTRDPNERKLLNVVEEMAIASGVPVPQVYLLPHENGINAFAAGHSTDDAVIGVTSGAVRLLNRDELQGVIGHEFSHVLNGDMRLNLRLVGWIFGILCLAVIGRVLLETRGRKNPLPLLGLALLLIGWIGAFFGRLIQAAVSRQREYLADASAVQFTRNPEGLASALKKIGGLAQGSRLNAPQAAEVSHMFFENGLGSSLFGLMSTHPPLLKRIQALDPSFNGRFTAVVIPREQEPPQVEPARSRTVFAGARVPFPVPGLTESFGGSEMRMPPVIAAPRLIHSVGSPQPEHLKYAEELKNSLPPILQQAAHEPTGASSIIYGLLLSLDNQMREAQLRELAAATSEFLKEETLKLLPSVRQVAVSARLPLVDLALPALRQFSPAQFSQFRTAVQKLVELDGEIDLFEYMLQKTVLRHLDPVFTGARKPVIQYYSLKALTNESATLLSGLAHVGSNTEEEAFAAFVRGAEPLSYAAQAQVAMVPAEACGLDMMDQALTRLAQAVPQIKKNVLAACAMTVASDGVIKETEVELLRAIADSLDCPVPPLVPGADAS